MKDEELFNLHPSSQLRIQPRDTSAIIVMIIMKKNQLQPQNQFE